MPVVRVRLTNREDGVKEFSYSSDAGVRIEGHDVILTFSHCGRVLVVDLRKTQVEIDIEGE